MRIVIFTGHADITSTSWFEVLRRSPVNGPVLVVRRLKEPGLRPLLRNLRANVRKHGIIFIPARIAMGVIATGRRLLRRDGHAATDRGLAPPEATIEATDIHAPEVLERVRAWSPDLGLSLGAPILRRSLFGIPARGTLNLHLGRVPQFRGAPPGFWELYEGATEIGATVHRVNDGLDTGPVVASALAPLYPTDRLEDAEARAEELGVRVMGAALERVARGAEGGDEQSPGGRTRRMPTYMTRARLWARLRVRALGRSVLSARWWLKLAGLSVTLGAVRPLRDLWRTLLARHPVRLFNFHRVTELCRDGMTVSPRLFKAQAEYIVRTHDVVPMERALELLESGARLRRPVAVITFDDAYASVKEYAAPILRELGAPATVFVSTSLAGTDRRFDHDAENPVRPLLGCMTWEQLAAVCADGWSVGAHTANHVRLSACNGAELERELREPLEVLDAHGLRLERTLAFPFGQPSDISDEAMVVAASAGYRVVFADCGGDNATGVTNGSARHRIDVGGDHPTLGWRSKVRGVPLANPRQWFSGWEPSAPVQRLP